MKYKQHKVNISDKNTLINTTKCYRYFVISGKYCNQVTALKDNLCFIFKQVYINALR